MKLLQLSSILLAFLFVGCDTPKPIVYPLPVSQPVRDSHDRVNKRIDEGKKKVKDASVGLDKAKLSIVNGDKSQKEVLVSVEKVQNLVREIENYLNTHDASPEVKAQMSSTLTELRNAKTKLFDLQKWMEEAQVEIIQASTANSEGIKKLEEAEAEIRSLRQTILPEYTDKVESQNQTLNDVEKRFTETRNELSALKRQSLWRKLLLGGAVCVGIVLLLMWLGVIGASKLR